MQAAILHLSDIHIKKHDDPILKNGKKIAAAIYPFLPDTSHVFIVISGDVAFSGEKYQYELATDFLNEIKKEIQNETTQKISFIITPGNHDCNFKNDSSARKILVKSIGNSDTNEIDDSVINACTYIQKDFFDFRNSLETNNVFDDDLLWRTSRFEVEGQIILFDCLNISWISSLPETPGYLYYPIDRYQERKDHDVDIKLFVLHQPVNWFSQISYRPIRKFIRERAGIVISGHEHQGNVGIIEETESDKSVFVEGCALQDTKDLSDSSFHIVVLDLQDKRFKSITHCWDGAQYSPKTEGPFINYHNLPAKKSARFAILESFQEKLDDPGAFFKHPGKINLTLTDIFIYPDLRKINNGPDRPRNITRSTNLQNPENIAGGVLIEGEEKVGCTSLLYQLYRYYHSKGVIPLYVNGKKIKTDREAEIDTLIKREVRAQYGKEQFTAFEQLPSAQKILLLDDFDDGPQRAAKARVGILCALKKRFGHIVVTVNEMFEFRELLEGDASRELISLAHYEVQPFGYGRRSELIERWYSLSSDGTSSDADFIAICDQAERVMDEIMSKTVIPPLPLYLLTLLQSLEAGRSGDFKASSLGYYYQYLLTEAFHLSGVKPDKLTEVFKYATQLAAEFHLRDKRELSMTELREFNTKFSQIWHTVDLSTRLELLIKSRVLCRAGEDYAFRYPYIYYYLKGKYLSENLNNAKVIEYINNCCAHIYVRDYANTILFLAHHTSEDYLLDTIEAALRRLFNNSKPISFRNDTTSVKKLIDESPKLVYSGETPSQHRKKVNAIRDDLDSGHDGLTESEEQADAISPFAQLTMLFKTTDILGQILKNQYATIPRTRKAELLEELFNAPLRALQDFYHFFEENTDTLVAEIEATIHRKAKGKNTNEEDRKKIAKQVVSGIFQIMTVSFLMRASQGANSDSLLEDIHNIVDKNGTLAFKIIEIFIILDSPKEIPRLKIEQLFKESSNDPLVMRLIHIMIIHKLYMFKTSEKEMQWIKQKINIDIRVQRSFAYQKKGLS